MATVDARPEWLPDEYEHFTVTREEVWQALDRDARRLFGLTADEFLRIFQNPPEKYHGDVRFRSLCHVADLIAEPIRDHTKVWTACGDSCMLEAGQEGHV